MKKYFAEFIGTMMLTLIACGVASILGCTTIQGIIATSLAFGLVIVAAAYSIGNVSGCHINPAVSVAHFFAGKMKLDECIKYIVSQVLGAFAGSFILWFLLGSNNALGANGCGQGMGANNVWITILVEVLLTFIFVTSILGVTSKKEYKNVSGLVIGLTLTLVHLVGIYFTGTSVNPARSLGPALLQGGKALEQVWVFLVAPLLGSALAALFYKFVLKEE